MSNPNLNKPNTNTAVKLSYSSMTTLQSCEAKYFHYKVANTAKDSDYVESDALGLGKAYHQVLETTLHRDYNDILILQAMTDNKVDPSEKDLLTVMVKKYVEFRKLSGIKIVKCELALSTQEYNGFIDFIAIRGDEWFIGDLKTAARHDENILSRLPMDPQLNLYAHFAEELDIAVPEIRGKRFAGCLYNQATKSKAGTMNGLEKGVKIFETFIPVEAMDPDTIWSIFNDAHDRARELHAGEAPKKNFSACFNYFSSCQYWSQCHGSTFTDCKSKVTLTTLNDLNEIEDLL